MNAKKTQKPTRKCRPSEQFNDATNKAISQMHRLGTKNLDGERKNQDDTSHHKMPNAGQLKNASSIFPSVGTAANAQLLQVTGNLLAVLPHDALTRTQ